MPIKASLTAKPVTLGDLLSNGKRYVVPSFQRDYAWDESEWRELWADLVDLSNATDERTNHYLGSERWSSSRRGSSLTTASSTANSAW